MKRKTKIIIASIIAFFVTIFAGIAIFAYYEYYGQYQTILNIDGTIKLDAFDVLYPELRKDPSYGKTPDNPFVIDNATRLRNLIKLNNNGKLEKSKQKDNVEKYYFCLQFDAQTNSQILDLASEGDFQTIGNNEYPFVDELSGVVYGYEYKSGYIAYYSGCLPVYTKVDSKIYINGVESDLDATAQPYNTWDNNVEYLCLEKQYNTEYNTVDLMTYDENSQTTYIKVSDTTIIHQIIANETIVATDNQIDIGFISNIENGGYAHDIILNNQVIRAKEEGLFESWLSNLASIFGEHKRVKTTDLDERHIGLFCGHISEGGNAKNISIAGESKIDIDTKRVNYFSNYTTVGYIDENAFIGGKLFSEIATDAMLDGEIAGVLFADEIYEAHGDATATNDYDGAIHYELTDISAEGAWPGTDGQSFEYGSFTFMLSSATDTVSSIWQNSGELKMLGDSNYDIIGSVLYCSDEYRYQANNGINQASASVKETVYNGVTKLENTGNVIDQGKYIIACHVNDHYYSVKIAAIEDSSGNITYYFDTTDKIDVTDFINGTGTLYQSSLWEVSVPSATPTFKNCRFETQYLKGDSSSSPLTQTNNLATTASQFGVSLIENTLYFDYQDGDVFTRYYLNFNESENTFYFSEEAASKIELFKVSDGYELTVVKNYASITELGSYLVIATAGDGNYYLVGVDTDNNTVLSSFTADLNSTNISGLSNGLNSPVTMTSTEYQTYLPYIWRVSKSGTNNLTFTDKLSSSLYLSHIGEALSLSANATQWTYGTGGNDTDTCRLVNNNYYISYDRTSSSTTTKYICTTANPGYTLYLYAITPQDETPPYITYDGARYLDAEASTIETGTYAVVLTDMNGEEYVVGVNNGNIATKNRYVQTTTYNSLYTYYSRSGTGTAVSPYTYTKASINSEYTYVNVTQNNFNTIKNTYGTLYREVNTYTEAFTIANNTNYYIFNGYFGTGYGYLSNLTDYSYYNVSTFERGNTYYTSSTNGNTGNMTQAFIIEQDTVYYSNTNGSVANSFNRNTTYYTRNTTYQAENQYNANYTYYYKTLNYGGPYYIDYLYDNGYSSYEWNVSDEDSSLTTSSAPYFKNVNSTNYYLNGVAVSSNSSKLFYDSINQQIFYKNSEINNYIYYNSQNSILSSTSMPISTKASLYKIELEYTYSDFNEINCRSQQIWDHSDYYYFVSTKNLLDPNNASYLIGADDYSAIKSSSANRTELDIGWFSMQNRYSYSSTNKTLKTTYNLSNYTWRGAGEAYPDSNNKNHGLHGIYNEAFESYSNKKSGYHLYLGVSDATSSRAPKLIYTNAVSGYSSNAPTGFVTYSETRNQSTEKGGYFIGFRAGGYPYYYNLGNTNPSVVAIRTSNNVYFTPNNYVGLYYYYAKAKKTTFILSLVSSKGDNLEENIHYAIAAKSGEGYYAMTYDSENASKGIYGTDMSQQINLIKDSFPNTYTSLTTIPSNCDWEQVSNDFNLRFKHYNSSNTTNMNYLDQTKTNGINSLTSSESYTSTTAYYYDTVNKILYYIYNNTNYYVTYDSTLNVFGVSVYRNLAAEIVIVRYNPSYIVERVTSIDSRLENGQYIFAGHSVDGYYTMGIENSTFVKNYDITKYLTTDLTEENYEEIKNYIWTQNNSSSISSSDSTITMLISNLETENGIAAYKTGSNKNYFTAFSSSSNYSMKINNNGLWSMKFEDGPLVNASTSYYLGFTPSSTTSNLKIVDTYIANVSYISGINSVSSSSTEGKQIAIYNTNDLTTAATSISSGSSYIMFIKSGTYWYLLYLNNNALASVQIGKNLDDLSDKLASKAIGLNYNITALTGPTDSTLTFGNYLYFSNGNTRYYLTANGTALTVSTSQQTGVTNQTMHWVYNYDQIYVNKSTLCTVTKATVNNNLGVSGSTVTPTGSATYLYTVTNDNKLGSIVSGSNVTADSKYAIVIFDNGYYYIVSRESANSTNITYVSYGSGLPTTLSEYEIFYGNRTNSQNSFTQTVGGKTYYLVMDVNKTLTLSTTKGNCYYTYSGTTGSGATFTGASTSAQYVVYLFRVSKNNDLDNSTDVTVTLTGKNKVDASLSVIQSDNYIIVSNVDDKYYVLSMEDYETIIPLDITDTMEEALNGGNIRLYQASVFEQLGSEYSLIFNSLAFSGSYYYLLDGTYENRIDNSLEGKADTPVVTPTSLYDSSEENYLLEITTVKSALSQVLIDEGEYYYYVSGYYIRAEEYVSSLVYYQITANLQSDLTEFAENTTYYTKVQSEYKRAYEYKNGVKYYDESHNVVTVTSDNFNNGTYYVYLSDTSYSAVSSKTTDINNISDDFKWTIYSYALGGQSGYVIGYYDDLQSNTSYIYYADGSFRLTTDLSLAIANNALVQVYRLGEEITTSETFKTFNIYLEKDNVTIISFPLNEVLDVNNIETYSSTTENNVSQENGTTMDVIPGEYLFAVKQNDHYYALTLDSTYEMAYSDITLLFDGNYIKDENGYYCISINTKYLWNQVIGSNAFTINSDTNISGLQFENAGYSGHKLNNNSNYDITINITNTSTGTATISCNGQYLAFAEGTGFTWVNGANNAATIYMYSVGASAAAESDREVLTYTYYSSDLNNINYSFFAFNKYHITDLPNYANAFGVYEYTTGWYINSTNMLTEVNDSVYFATEIGKTASSFNQVSYTYDYLNGSGTYTPMTLNYYAPTGSTSFAISDVSDTDPVYVSIIVSTELMLQSFNQVNISSFAAGTTYYTRSGSGTASSPYVYHVATTYQSGTTYYTNTYNENLARYLSLWKVAEYDAETAVAYKPGTTEVVSTAAGYQSIFSEMLLTPYAAIPLANHYDTTRGTSSASLVKVNDTYYYLSDYDYDHLLAHTFVLTEPGIYYLGTTTGSVAISYLSIDKMRDVDESEDSSKNISEEFTIDYVWGESETGSTFSQINTSANVSDSGIGTIAYVGRTSSDDSLNWVHSNIYPEFINGTPGVWEPDNSKTYYNIDVSIVKHIVSFTPGTTYYTKEGNSYTEATTFDYNNDYYVLENGNYELVHEGYDPTKTYYYIVNKDNNLYFEPASTYARKVTYFTLDVQTASISSFASNTRYYTLSDYSYIRVNIDSFAAGITYYTFDGSNYNVASSYDASQTYYVRNANYMLIYNPTDYMNMTIERTYNANTNVSTTTVDYETYDNIYNYGYGVMYINSNKLSTRSTRVIILIYTEHND